jgi:hypothetical protein
MAQDKKGFLLYADQYELFSQLPDDVAGQLIKHIFKYVNDEDPQTDNALINIAFTPIKQQLKRDLEKWAEIREKRSEAGKKSAEARRNKAQQNEQMLTSVKSVEQSSTKSTVNVNDNVNVNVNVNDNVINNKRAQGPKHLQLFKEFGLDQLQDQELESMWGEFVAVKKKKKASTSEDALKRQLKKLHSYSGGNVQKMKLILDRSINGGWSDIYELKQEQQMSKAEKFKQVGLEAIEIARQKREAEAQQQFDIDPNEKPY